MLTQVSPIIEKNSLKEKRMMRESKKKKKVCEMEKKTNTFKENLSMTNVLTCSAKKKKIQKVKGKN